MENKKYIVTWELCFEGEAEYELFNILIRRGVMEIVNEEAVSQWLDACLTVRDMIKASTVLMNSFDAFMCMTNNAADGHCGYWIGNEPSDEDIEMGGTFFKLHFDHNEAKLYEMRYEEAKKPKKYKIFNFNVYAPLGDRFSWIGEVDDNGNPVTDPEDGINEYLRDMFDQLIDNADFYSTDIEVTESTESCVLNKEEAERRAEDCINFDDISFEED